jgi:hypothetical protein
MGDRGPAGAGTMATPAAVPSNDTMPRSDTTPMRMQH